jgi:GT2 family glycosyltransferase
MAKRAVESPLVSVLVVTWNRKDDVLETIHSVYEQAYHNFEIVIVDNGSTDGTVEAIRQAYPKVKLVALNQNVGTSAGRNAGIAVTCGDIIFCLDSDASPGSNSLTNLVSKFQTDPEIGVINSKILNAFTKEIDHGPGWAYSEKQKASQDQEFLSWSFSEGGAAIRKEVFERVGLFWETLFFGCEGQEFSLRVWDSDYKILYYPDAVVYHRASPQARVADEERDLHFFKNSLYIYIVRYPWWVLIWYAPMKTIVALVRGVRRGYLRKTICSLLDVIRKFPVLLEERQPIRNKTARHYLKMQSQHGPLSWDLLSWLKYKT